MTSYPFVVRDTGGSEVKCGKGRVVNAFAMTREGLYDRAFELQLLEDDAGGAGLLEDRLSRVQRLMARR